MESTIIIMGVIGIVILFLINKSKFSGAEKVCLSIAAAYHFILQGVLVSFIIDAFPNLISFLNKIPFSMGGTLIVTISLYLLLKYYIGRK